MTGPYYPNHRVQYPKDSDYVDTKCANCGSPEVIWFDKAAQEVECYDCGSIYFLSVSVEHNNR